MRITELMKDKAFVTEMLNGPFRPRDEKQEAAPINPDWIDMESSNQVTKAFHRLLPDGIPYCTHVIVERNPDTMYDGTSVDDNEKRMRYFVISIVPDTQNPYNLSFPLIHHMWTSGLFCWELSRATLAAATNDIIVLLANDPLPPILNDARIFWVSLYLGREPYHGIIKLSEQRVESEDFDGWEHNVNLYKVREMEKTPILQRLMDAYDIDYPETRHEVV